MLCRGELVVKLPESRVDALVEAGAAERFDARGDGRRMREWASVPADRSEEWRALAEEAHGFVAGAPEHRAADPEVARWPDGTDEAPSRRRTGALVALRNMMARLGAGGAKVDAVLDSPNTTPGGRVTGTVHLHGGKVAQDVNEIRVALEATVEVESGDHSWRENVTFGTSAIAGASRIEAGEQRAVPFGFASRGSARSPRSTAGSCAACASGCAPGSTSPARSTPATSTR